ncbi:Threonine--tRNA ligase [uncultured archaeon]|nr:Threonine--tRNA ligase [uncultured archaeon]
MRVLLVHSDYLRFESKKKAGSFAEETRDKTGGVEDDVLVAFFAVEKVDETNPASVTKKLVDEVNSLAQKVDAKNVALYPYAHLSSNLGDPKTAQKILSDAHALLKEKWGDKAIYAPFGWYKSFEIKCKGHPLSELSRTLLPDAEGEKNEGAEKKGEEKDVSEALKKEEKLKSTWHILTQDGKLTPLADYDYKGEIGLKKLATYETQKVRAVDREPPHVALMKRLELVDYEPGSDAGNLRYYPKGRFIKSLLEQYVSEKIVAYGGMEVETPIMYDFNHKSLKSYLNRFPARQYTVLSDDSKFFLRFAACFGQFLIAHDATISYRQLPLRFYELTRYSFRREKSGELTGLRRLRAFTMPDCHALVADVKQALPEYKTRFKLCLDTVEGAGIDRDGLQLAIRVTEDFYSEHKEFLTELVREWGKPAVVEMWKERVFYFVLKYEFNFVDTLDKASALSTDQIDVENGERYDMTYVAEDGSKKHPLVLHCSPSGAIERLIYALLENAHRTQEAGGTPTLPLWLAPTQVRILPLSENFNETAIEAAEALNKEGIRADVDDRNESVGRRIREAEREWAPYILVIGDKEKETKKFQARIRGEKEQRTLTLIELAQEIHQKTEGKPTKKLPLPLLLSKRPKFVG